MSKPVMIGFPVVGAIFLVLAVAKFLNGEGWVVWAILGVLFGGLGVFGRNRSGGNKA